MKKLLDNIFNKLLGFTKIIPRDLKIPIKLEPKDDSGNVCSTLNF